MSLSLPTRTLPEEDLDQLLAIGQEAARRAGAILLEHWVRPPSGVRAKTRPTDLVSAADLAAEDAIRALLAVERPADGILGEERGEVPSVSGLRWVVDPLDGTANYLRRIPHWAVSIACEDAGGDVILGVVHDPLREEWFVGLRGRGATVDGSRMRGSAGTALDAAVLAGEFSSRTGAQADCARRLLSSVGHARDHGSAALDLAWAAAGRVDAAFHVRFPARWDVAAGELLCREAGLTFERLPDPRDTHDRLLAAPPALAPRLRALVRAG
jgi:myo-inositol-1(or 4)-monophosphatase